MKRLLLALLLLSAPVESQAQTATRIRGTILGVQETPGGTRLTIRARDGRDREVDLTRDARVIAIVRSRIEQIRDGSFIGTAAVPQPDGSFRALEVQVFPQSMRGNGDGDRPYDLQPHSSMTNGTVASLAGHEGRRLTLRYHDGQKIVVVPAGVPIITYEPGLRSMLTAGAHVILFATPAADGSFSAAGIGVGKDGLTPPM